MADPEILAYLGDVEATDEQIEALERLGRDLDGIYEDTIDRMEAFNAGAAVILGDATTQETVDKWKAAHAHLAQMTIQLRGALAVDLQSTPESVVAEKYGIARGTVRKAAGK